MWLFVLIEELNYVLPDPKIATFFSLLIVSICEFPSKICPSNLTILFLSLIESSFVQVPRFSRLWKATKAAMEAQQSGTAVDNTGSWYAPMKLLFVEMGVFNLPFSHELQIPIKWFPYVGYSSWLNYDNLVNSLLVWNCMLQPIYYSCSKVSIQGCHLFLVRFLHFAEVCQLTMLFKFQFLPFIKRHLIVHFVSD